MSGHSHWAGIKHKKAVVDAKKGKLFSKLAKRIIIAARHGGGDLDMNLQLKYAIDAARAANMPKDKIEYAIKKGTGEVGVESYEEILYEGYAPGGVAVLMQIVTDNRNRTAAEVRKLFENRGGNLGATGCVAWMFGKKGYFTFDASQVDEERLMEVALDAGAEDVNRVGDVFEVLADPRDYESVRNRMVDAGIEPTAASISFLPRSKVAVDAATGRRVLALLEALEDHDDVESVSANLEFSADVLAEIGAD